MPRNAPPVGLLLVSHSAKLAEGVADIIRGLAGYVPLATVGGPDDALGASPGDILTALEGMQATNVLVFVDIGSSALATGAALDAADTDLQSRVRVVNGPFVEGAILAGIHAMDGDTAAECIAAAESDGLQLVQDKVPNTDET